MTDLTKLKINMGAKLQQNPDFSKELLYSIIATAGKMEFSQSVARRFVGGRGRLDRLIREGKVLHWRKPSNTQNGKVYYNAGEILRNTLIRIC